MASKSSKSVNVLGVETESIKEFAKFFSENGVAHLHIKQGDIEIEMRKYPEQSAAVAPAPPHPPVYPVPHAPAPAAGHAPVTPPAAAETASEADSASDANVEEVTSPIVGTFYRAPSPDSPPYASEGDSVSEDSVICIVEAMKMMNELKAGVKGRVKKILVQNGDAVSAGQPLFRIEKA